MNIHDFIGSLPIKTFVEIGAHFGTDTEIFHKMHPTARIVCFEPDPRNIAMLRGRGIDTFAEVYPYAVSNSPGAMKFYLSSGSIGTVNASADDIFKQNDWSCSSSLKRPTGHLHQHKWVSFNKTVDVQCVRLDDFEPLKNTAIDFIWADVQGAEDLVFSGATETLKRTKYIYTEYSWTELYEGDCNKDKILQMFGDEWVVVHDFGGDILLKNTTL